MEVFIPYLLLYGTLQWQPVSPGQGVEAYLHESLRLTLPDGRNTLVLRPSEAVSEATLEQLQGQQVRLVVQYQPGRRPDRQKVACPTDAQGLCLPQGEGYQVIEWEPMDPPADAPNP